MSEDTPKIAVLIPCHNEESAIGTVVGEFRRALPAATVYVYDNRSSDRTVEIARAAGAEVRKESLRGKGNVVRRMFADVEADIYLLVDGDGTYDAASAPTMIETLRAGGLDMVNCARRSADGTIARFGHTFGNWLLTWLVAQIFGNQFSDMLSGYRAMSRRFVKSFPALSAGFETETELTIHALELRAPIEEMSAPYHNRPQGSQSKLHTFRDGARILRVIVHLVKEERPLQFFGWLALLLGVTSIGLGWPVVSFYFESGTVPRMPTALLATGFMIVALLSLSCGLVLDTVTRGRREFKRLMYLAAEQRARPPRHGS